MSSNLDSAREDLAFMRALVQAGDDGQKAFGEAYFAAGVCYGGQMLLHFGQLLGLVTSAPPFALWIGLGPTALFLVIFAWIIWRNRLSKPSGMTGRAVAVVFGTIGMTNLALIAIIGAVSIQERSSVIFLIYPCAVFALQGAAWMIAFMLRQRAWLAVVGLGWFVCGVAMALSIHEMPRFDAFAAAGIFGCMMAPGWAMLRLASKSA